MSAASCSKSKAKRLQRKAKTERIAEKFVKERSGRIQAEKSLELWKDKAILYRRYVQYI